MATIKSFTDLSQSKTLSKILPLESADMMYHSVENEYGTGTFVATSKLLTNGLRNDDFYIDDIPCWSLAALKNLLPAGIKIKENTYLFESHNTFDKSWVYRYYNEDDASYLYYKNTSEIDACVAMIEKLNELNLL